MSILPPFPNTILFVIAALFGAIVGSFLNVVILRLPDAAASIIYPASRCPRCRQPLSWHENIPVISYLYLRGRCRHCHEKISWQYPAVELTMALLSAALVWKFALTAVTAGFFLLIAALVVISVIDIRLQIIPDAITLPGIAVGFLFALVSGHITWRDSLLGIFLGGGILSIVAGLYQLLRHKEGMGGGDIKLLAMLGAFFGWQSLPFIILASSLTGSVIGLAAIALGKRLAAARIPFGPYLAGAAVVYLFFAQQIQWYLSAYTHGAWP
ncbi:MAG: prepilin peptidase [Desulfobulbaceae bacterium]|jgi:leader peptidase (prepilin peptidase)/N-methyltransferase|nr:prepilin peptidase [Desulfobulbaceae bacterium]